MIVGLKRYNLNINLFFLKKELIIMFKNLKIKFIGLLIIAMFMISAVPACSAEEAQKGISTELLVTKTLPELVNVMNINNSQKKELNDVLNNPNLLYGHTVQKLGCNLTMVNYLKLTEFLQNTSNSEADWTFYNQWINDTQQVVTYKSMTDTVENIYMSNPLLQATVQGYEDSYVKYNQLNEYEQWRFIQTKSITTEDISNAYANATPDQMLFMINQSLPELSHVQSLEGLSVNDILNDFSNIVVDIQKDIINFNDKTMWAYESYVPSESNNSTDPVNESLSGLINARDSANKACDLVILGTTMLGSLSVTCFILFIVFAATAELSAGVGFALSMVFMGLSVGFFIGAGILSSLISPLTNRVNDLTDKIHTLYPNYDDSHFHPCWLA
jgi:hypothetical protein